MSQSPFHKIDLNDFWPYQAAVLSDHIMRHTLSIVKSESKLNTSQWRVLAAVIDKPHCSAADVTAITPMDKTIVSRAVKSLIEDGIIEKKSSPQDKRVSHLTATPEGIEIYKRIATRLTQSVKGTDQSGEFLAALQAYICLLYTSPSPRDRQKSRMPSSA